MTGGRLPAITCGVKKWQSWYESKVRARHSTFDFQTFDCGEAAAGYLRRLTVYQAH